MGCVPLTAALISLSLLELNPELNLDLSPSHAKPLELICEKAIATCNRPLGAGEALRRVMECLASGILLPGTVPTSLSLSLSLSLF